MKLGNIQSMLKQAQKVKEQIDKLQAEAGEKVLEASAGGGMVTALAKAKGEIVAIKIEPQLIKDGDVEMLQDLITVAVNEALGKGKEIMKEEIAKVAGGLGLPPGLL
ncbi:MAG: YbaB/EbfC family nucleoid-associated protein [Deltaproteobacteria bacterium]